MSRRRSIEIYLKQNVAIDDHIYKVWKSLKTYGYPQSTFRKALLIGINHMMETGEISLQNISSYDIPKSYDDTGIIKSYESQEKKDRDHVQENNGNNNYKEDIQPIEYIDSYQDDKQAIIETFEQAKEQKTTTKETIKKMGKFM